MALIESLGGPLRSRGLWNRRRRRRQGRGQRASGFGTTAEAEPRRYRASIVTSPTSISPPTAAEPSSISDVKSSAGISVEAHAVSSPAAAYPSGILVATRSRSCEVAASFLERPTEASRKTPIWRGSGWYPRHGPVTESTWHYSIVSPTSGSSRRKATLNPSLAGPANERSARFSPDGGTVAYVSDVSGCDRKQ